MNIINEFSIGTIDGTLLVFIYKVFHKLGDHIRIDQIKKEVNKNEGTHYKISDIKATIDDMLINNIIDEKGGYYYWNWNISFKKVLTRLFKNNKLERNINYMVAEEVSVSKSSLITHYIIEILKLNFNKGLTFSDIYSHVKDNVQHIYNITEKYVKDILESLVKIKKLKKTSKSHYKIKDRGGIIRYINNILKERIVI